MIGEGDILPYGRFKYSQPYAGSYQGLRYKIVHPKPAEGEENLIHVEIWPEPNCREKTDESLIEKQSFPYSEDGYRDMIVYLNEMYDSHKGIWY